MKNDGGAVNPQTVREELSLICLRKTGCKECMFKKEICDDCFNEAESALRELMEGVVPDAKWTGLSEGGRFYKDWCSPEDEAWNACRKSILTNIARVF